MTNAVLALAASSFSQPSETFIRDHARTIAPQATILLCHETPPPGLSEFPALSGIDMGAKPYAPGFGRRATASVRRYWRRYASPYLSSEDKKRITAFLDHHAASALLAEYGPTGVMLARAARAAGVPLFVHFHGFDAAVVSRLPLWAERYRRLFAAAAGVIAPSRFIADKLKIMGCPDQKLHVCACGIDPGRFAPAGGSSSRLAAVGRLVEKKAPHVTIAAFGKIADRFPNARLDIVGDGPLAERCRRLIADLGLSDRVCLHGRQNHEFVSELMGRASMFVQHSVTSAFGDVEGMPVSVLEAMASALPVVSTRHSGIPEAVEQGVSGLLVAERDVDGMAEAMASLLNDQARAAQMGAAGRRRVLERYTQERSGETLRAIMGL